MNPGWSRPAIRVVVADDQALLRHSLSRLLTHDPRFTVVGEAADGIAAVGLARLEKPDVVLMDLRMPRQDGVQATAQICRGPLLTHTRVLILTMFERDELVHAALRAGACGFLLKDSDPDELLMAVQRVHAGDLPLAPSVLRSLIAQAISTPHGRDASEAAREAGLTPREREVLELIGHGCSNTEIESQLYISHGTMKTHVSRLLSKLEARDRAQLVIAAYRLGLVSPGERACGWDREDGADGLPSTRHPRVSSTALWRNRPFSG